jgi:hypothetical protein
MGDPPRARYYSYAWIERLMGMEIENSRRILPAFHHLQVGDVLDRAGTMTVLSIEPEHHLVLGPPTTEPVGASWAFALYPVDIHHTRLVVRVRGSWSYRWMLRHNPPFNWPFYLLIEPGAFLMQRRMLREIKARGVWRRRDRAHHRSPGFGAKLIRRAGMLHACAMAPAPQSPHGEGR